MFGIENYTAFIIAGIILNLTPGADTIYILGRSVAQGKKAGYMSVYGIVTGCLVHILLAAFGLSAILSHSTTAFLMIKYAGVAYLLYMGIKIFVDKDEKLSESLKNEELSYIKIYRQGMFTNLLNPKVALFFMAFMPQFINPAYAEGSLPFIILGLTFLATGTIWCLFLAYASSYITKKIRTNEKTGRFLKKINGLIFIGLGVKLFFQKR